MARSSGREKAALNVINARIDVISAAMSIDLYGEEAIVDNELNLVLARQLRFEGSGVNNSNTSGWGKRFNGATMSNSSAPFFDLGALIVDIEFSCSNNVTGRSLEIRHFNSAGGDSKTVGIVPIDKFDNQFGRVKNVRFLIPGGRRFAPFMAGGSFRIPQWRLSYRQVLEVL